MGSTTHCDRIFAVSKQWEAAAAILPENPAARLTAKGDRGPISSSDLSESNFTSRKRKHEPMRNLRYVCYEMRLDILCK